MADTQPDYISAAALIVNTLQSNGLGLEDWPYHLWLQEQRIAYFQGCFSDAQKLLPDIHIDFHILDPVEHFYKDTADMYEPLWIHAEMWQSMYNVAKTLTQPGVRYYLTFLSADRTAKKTVDYLRPVQNRLVVALEEAEKQSKEINERFKDVLEDGPMVKDEVAQGQRYQRWKRSYSVLRDIVRILYRALKKICRWLAAKIESMSLAMAKLAREKTAKKAAKTAEARGE